MTSNGQFRCLLRRAEDLKEALRSAAEFSPATVVLDVEPLVSRWNAGEADLEEGVWRISALVRSRLPSCRLVLITNSKRSLRSQVSQMAGITYVVAGRKPWRSHGLRSEQGPVVVIGDQVLTDGILAWRLRARPGLFLYVPSKDRQGSWPRLQAAAEAGAMRLLFCSSPIRTSSGA